MREKYMTARRLLSLFGLLSLAVFTVFAGADACAKRPSRDVVMAQDTVRVDYSDGVSCYHREDSISCVFIPSRVPMGPVAPAVLPEEVLSPKKEEEPPKQQEKPKLRKPKAR
jgi:hypothetical protein